MSNSVVKGEESEHRRAARQALEHDRRAGYVVDLGYYQQRLLSCAVASVTFGTLAVAYGRVWSWHGLLALLCSVGWYGQAHHLAKMRATFYNAGTLDWRRQNVFIRWWCNPYLPLIVGIAPQLWWLL